MSRKEEIVEVVSAFKNACATAEKYGFTATGNVHGLTIEEMGAACSVYDGRISHLMDDVFRMPIGDEYVGITLFAKGELA